MEQQFTFRKVTYSGNDSHDCQLAARHSGRCVDVSGVSTAHALRFSSATGQGSPLNQTWRLLGR